MIYHDQDLPDLITRVWPGRLDAPAVVLLHGSGGDETSLVNFARAACPDRTLIAVRGRIPWEEGYAHFARHPDRSLDVDDLAVGAAVLQRLLLRLATEEQKRPVLLGYSNGAIVAAAAVELDHPLTSAAVLLRPLSPWPERCGAQLDEYPILMISGTQDQRRDPQDAPLLEEQFHAAGARTTSLALDVGHPLTPPEEGLVYQWLQDLDHGASRSSTSS